MSLYGPVFGLFWYDGGRAFMSLYPIIQTVYIFHLLTLSSSVLSSYSIPNLPPNPISKRQLNKKSSPALFLLAFTEGRVLQPQWHVEGG